MRHFIEPNVVSRLSGLALDARMPMAGSVSGRHRSLTRGSSLEFSEYRNYVPGDDTRRLDWRAWGRSDRFYIKEFEADTNLRLCLVMDVSGSMAYGSRGSQQEGATKLDYARFLCGTLAYLVAGQGDAVGLSCAGADFRLEIPPRRNAAHLKHILDEMSKLKAEGETGLSEALHAVAEKVSQRALIVIVSDLFTDTDALRKAFQHLRFRRHDVAVFHLLEQNEIEFEFDRPIRFVDLEGAPPMLVDPTTMARQYRNAVQTWLEDVTQIVRNTAVDYHRVSIHEHYAEVLARFLLARKK
ncbi:MAG: DUF58 domain-containing protein [Fuerstiella sp.]|nr:DUF58 domain-containing protein [Fuerstiella sp.]